MSWFGKIYNTVKSHVGRIVTPVLHHGANLLGSAIKKVTDFGSSLPVIGDTIKQHVNDSGIGRLTDALQSAGGGSDLNRVGSAIGNVKRYYQRE